MVPSCKGVLYQCPWGTILYGIDRQNQCPFAKGQQNSAPKGTVLRTIKWWPKGTILVPSISLSVDMQHF